jgi:hypothetical protein
VIILALEKLTWIHTSGKFGEELNQEIGQIPDPIFLIFTQYNTT